MKKNKRIIETKSKEAVTPRFKEHVANWKYVEDFRFFKDGVLFLDHGNGYMCVLVLF